LQGEGEGEGYSGGLVFNLLKTPHLNSLPLQKGEASSTNPTVRM